MGKQQSKENAFLIDRRQSEIFGDNGRLFSSSLVQQLQTLRVYVEDPDNEMHKRIFQALM